MKWMLLKERKSTLGYILKIPIKYSTYSAIMIAILKIIGGIIPTLNMFAIAKFINSAITLFKYHSGYSDIIIAITLIMICTAYEWIYDYLVTYDETRLENDLRVSFKVYIINKVTSLKYSNIENQNTCDLISRVCKEPEKQCKDAYSQFFDILSLLITICGVVGVLAMNVFWSALLIVAISIPLLKLAINGGKASYQANRQVRRYIREVDYLSEVLNGRDAVDERMLFCYSNKINEKWHRQFEKTRKLLFKVNLKWFIKAKSGGIITAFISLTTILILLFSVRSGQLSIGLFISIVNSETLLIQNLSWQLPSYVNSLAKNKEYIVDLIQILNLPGKKEYLDEPISPNVVVNSLEFKDVSFKYPGTEKYVLKNMSFKIEKGKHYALVGTNGSGKTTITKLITGLYEDFEGEILINGKSIRQYSQCEIKSMFSIVYQDFARYFISVKDNIYLGCVNKYQNKDIESFLDILSLKDTIEKLPNGLNSNLGKIQKDGVDLSGGEWQKVAMARAMMSSSELRILDEPTAALDPISENDMYQRFSSMSKGSTTIFISHRLGSTKIADNIFVIDQGKIAEQGSFDELIENNGLFAKMFESQKSWYFKS